MLVILINLITEKFIKITNKIKNRVMIDINLLGETFFGNFYICRFRKNVRSLKRSRRKKMLKHNSRV